MLKSVWSMSLANNRALSDTATLDRGPMTVNKGVTGLQWTEKCD